MSLFQHIIELIQGTTPSRQDRLVVGFGSKANLVGGGAGQSVTTTVTPGGQLPASYNVAVDPGQDATWYVTNKTATSFQVVLNPRLAANTLAAGTFTWTITG